MDNQFYAEMLKDMDRDVMEFFSSFDDDPSKMSGYGHDYFCEDDGGRLVFALDSPKEHKCPVCDVVYTGGKYDRAWVYLYRIRAIQDMLKSAYLYKATKKPCYVGFIKNTLDYYGKNYSNFALHIRGKITANFDESIAGSGRIMPQGLNEAMALIKILLALDILGDENALDPDFCQSVKDNLIAPAIDGLLAHQITAIHNIKCWVLSAIGMAGIFFKEDKWLHLTFESEYNIRRQLLEGVTDDDFWYEGSIHYNYFTLEGVLSLMYFCKKYGREFGEGADIPRRMLLASYEYAFENGMLPSPNDGWPNINLKTYVFQYYNALDAYEDASDIKAIIKDVNDLEIKRVALPLWDPYHFKGVPLEAMFKAPITSAIKPPKRKSILYPSSNFAFLRNDRINLFLKYGHNGPSHAHPDKMTFDLMIDNTVITRDLANSGYGSEVCNQWHRMTASHNTIAIDGGNHTNTELGQILHFSDNEVKAKAAIRDGITFVRSFSISSDEIVDEFSVQGESEHVWDYFLHIDGDMDCDRMKTPANLEFNSNGYQHIKNVENIKECFDFNICVKDVRCKIKIVSECDEIFLCDTLDNPATKFRKTLVLRKRGRVADFKVVWNLQ